LQVVLILPLDKQVSLLKEQPAQQQTLKQKQRV
jgi:hypothetical protein